MANHTEPHIDSAPIPAHAVASATHGGGSNGVEARQASWHGLSAETLVQFYRNVCTSRTLDDREISMKKGNKIFFQISGAGHEVPLVAAGMILDPRKDWFYPYYRDRALCLTLGMTPTEILMEATGAAADPNSGGRQMPCHWGHKDLNIVSQSSCTGTQFLQAAGAAQVGRIMSELAELRGSGKYTDDEVVYVSSGDGATSEGEFWEAVNTACTEHLPVLFMIEDNGYAISVPVEVQTAGGSISRLVSSFPGLHIAEFDGCNPLESYSAIETAVQYVRDRKGPALCHAHVIRPYSHSMSDDEKLYRCPEERADEARRDPTVTFGQWLIDEGILTPAGLEALKQDVLRECMEAEDAAVAAPAPTPDSWSFGIYSPDVDPTSAAFDTDPWPSEGEKSMVDLINACVRDEMRRDPRIVVFGEDVADVTKAGVLEDLKGKGGVFKVTAGLQREFGSTRVFNSPLAEANIIGRAIGMATRGLRPVVEVQFFDYIWPAFMQLRNELSNIRWRSNNHFSAPVVVRVPIGGYLKGGAPYHSQSGEVLFTHIPGLRVVMPSNAADANGLLRTAIRCDDPVMFLEHKHLYYQPYNRAPYPGDNYMIPFGKARVVQEGTDLTVITYGALVERARKAAELLAREQNIHVELIDLRSLSPYDWDAISTSVKKTNKCLVAYEDHISFGYGAEIAARVADELFEWLDGPVRRVGAKDTFVAYAPVVEDAILPQVEDLRVAMESLHRY